MGFFSNRDRNWPTVPTWLIADLNARGINTNPPKRGNKVQEKLDDSFSEKHKIKWK